MAAAWLPTMMASPAAGFLLAAMAPSSMVASINGAILLCWSRLRAMWRCVTWLSSCPMTVASSSRSCVAPISPY